MDQYQEIAALAAFDALNAQDSRVTETVDGPLPYELAYGIRMSERLAIYAPDAPVALRLAARAQHLERWKFPRATYPVGRTGYFQWRNDMKAYHAQRASEILAVLNVAPEIIDRVAHLIRKKQLLSDPETQLLEDVICHVFLEFYLEEFAIDHAEAQVLDILYKTWDKMSEAGKRAAMDLPTSLKVRSWIDRILEVKKLNG
ncbi:DUF4202 domain-containing protein [Lewinella sp. 4G2]|uniref:DUF4202 domain-containing protein n=1 Tax=Lewinella sp. 4G2 TaxID=1803372 RepID=UPI0007B4A3D8|nr:DUF4202 domain-containing protein [Lewinella sp. 4G2]OAV44567.1 hypothetical protein A3850_008710 [Lewinella sp. 4G2]